MTLDEHIKKAEEDAVQAESDSDWGFGNYFIDRTEALEYAENCRQFAEWLKDYKRLLEQEPCEDWYDVPSDEMNLEQAKQAVRDLRKFIVDNHISPKLQYCEDAISRQAVEKITWEEPSYTDALNALTEVREKVRALPPVTPQPKIGHWIQTNEFFINQDGQFIYKFICSECKSLSYFRKSNKKAIGANVCPNCGVKMIEPQKSEV